MNVQATAKGVKISSRKAGLVASLVRGRSVADAVVILDHTPKKAAPLLKKVIESAAANATHNHGLKESSLAIAELTIGIGPSLKRMRPAAFGRARPYKHPSSHIKVVLSGQPVETKAKPPAKTKAAAGADKAKRKG